MSPASGSRSLPTTSAAAAADWERKSTLDVLAIYIRENQEHLNMSQLRELEQTMNRIARIIDGWRNNRFLIRRNSFNTAPLQKALEEKLHRFDKQLPQKLN